MRVDDSTLIVTVCPHTRKLMEGESKISEEERKISNLNVHP